MAVVEVAGRSDDDGHEAKRQNAAEEKAVIEGTRVDEALVAEARKARNRAAGWKGWARMFLWQIGSGEPRRDSFVEVCADGCWFPGCWLLAGYLQHVVS